MYDEKVINCRICLRYDLKESSKCLSLFETYNGCSISEKVSIIAKVDIKEGDGLPDMICPDCLLQLENAVMFKQKCEASNKILRCNVLLAQQTIAKKTEESTKCEEPVQDSVKTEKVDPVINPDLIEEHLEFSDTEERLEDITKEVIEQPMKKSKAIDLQLICDDCKGTFKSKCKLRVHWKKVHQPEKLVCQKCLRMFRSYKAFNIHIKSNNKNCIAASKVRIEGQGKSRIFHCKECNYKSKRIKDMDSHLVTHTGERRYQCKDCSKSFTQHASLQGHRETCHKDYRIDSTCHLCGKHIQGRNKFYRHMKTHKDQKVQCKVCNKELKSKRYLELHMRRHSGIKSYSCEICAASFYTYCEVYNHRLKVHFKSKNLKCDVCGYKMTTAQALKKHKAKHTPTNAVCLFCGQFSENAEKLAIHQKRHFDRRIQCPQCDNKYHNKKSLYRHMNKQHRCTMLVEKRELPKTNEVKIKEESSGNKNIVILLSQPTIVLK